MTDDLIRRLRRWTHDVDAASACDLMDEAACEIERLRFTISRLAGQDATLSVRDGAVTATMDSTLTDAELEAVEMFAATAWTAVPWSVVERHAATLRGLPERHKGGGE